MSADFPGSAQSSSSAELSDDCPWAASPRRMRAILPSAGACAEDGRRMGGRMGAPDRSGGGPLRVGDGASSRLRCTLRSAAPDTSVLASASHADAPSVPSPSKPGESCGVGEGDAATAARSGESGSAESVSGEGGCEGGCGESGGEGVG